MVRRSTWLLALVVLAFGSVALAQVVPESATYDEATNVLSITFDGDVRTEAGTVQIGRLVLDDDDGGLNADYTLPGGMVVNSTATGTEVQISLLYGAVISEATYTNNDDVEVTYDIWGTSLEGVEYVEASMAHDELSLIIPTGAFIATDDAAIAGATLPVTYVADVSPVTIQSVVYNDSTNTFKFTFSDKVQFDSEAEDAATTDANGFPMAGNGTLNALPPEDINENGILDLEQNIVLGSLTFEAAGGVLNPTSATVATLVDSSVIDIRLSPSEQYSWEMKDLASGILLSTEDFSFVDVNYNSVVPVEDLAVTFETDTTPLQMLSASYDLGNNQLLVDYDASLSPSIATLAKASRMTFQLVDASDAVLASYTLETASSISKLNLDTTLSMLLISTDAMHVEEMIDTVEAGETMQLVAARFAAYDAQTNGSVAGTVDLTLIDETATKKAPEINGTITYDAASNVLLVPFDLSLSADIVVEGFSFSSGDDEVVLADAEAERADGNKSVALTLSGAEAYALENFADKDALVLNIDPFSVIQSRTVNGNRQVSAVAVDYTADDTDPLPATVFYDLDLGAVFIEIANTEVNPETDIDISQITLCGVALAEGDSVEVVDDYSSLHYLPTSVVTSLRALDNATKLQPYVSFGAGFITNGDGTSSAAISEDVVDGETLSNGTVDVALALGYGRRIQIDSYEVFPTDPRAVNASLRGVTDHAYWYVDNEVWGGIVDADEVAAAMASFEDSTPYDATMGSYDVVMEMYAGDNAEYVPDVVSFFFVDVLDEYDLGRNDADADLWTPGYLNVDNDMIILDCDPSDYNLAPDVSGGSGQRQIAQLFARFVTYKVDRYEVEWLRYSLGYFAEFLIGSRDVDSTGFTEPDFGGAGTANTAQNGNELTFLGDDVFDRNDYEHGYLFLLYLYEKYGAEELITEIATSPRINTEGIEKIISNRWDEGLYDDTPYLKDTINDIFLDFATANILDLTMDGAPYHGLYEFHNAATLPAAAPGTALKWANSVPPPYTYTGTNWGFNYYLMAYNAAAGDYLPLLGDFITLYIGENADDHMFRKLNFKVDQFGFGEMDEFNIQEIEFADGYSTVPLSNGDDWTFGLPSTGAECPMTILVEINGGDVTLTSSTETADYTELFVAQNNVYNNSFLIYIISSEEVYSAPGVESPIVYATTELAGGVIDTSIYIDDVALFNFSSNVGPVSQYTTSVWLTDEGEYEWHASGYYASGLALDVDPSAGLTVTSVEAGASKTITLGEDASLSVSGRAFDRSQSVSMIANSSNASDKVRGASSSASTASRVVVSDVYSINAEQKTLADPATLTLPFDAGLANSETVGIYYKYNGSWEYVGGVVDAENSVVTTRVAKLGDFQVMAGQTGTIIADLALPTSYELKQNYPNPFNPSTTIEMVLPNAGNVHLVIYDVLGREVTRLVDGPMNFGTHKVVWNGRNANGQSLASGVYFAQLRADNFRYVRKMVLVK